MNAQHFEETVREIEGITIRIRSRKYDEIGDFRYERKAAGRMTVRHWLNTRIYPSVGDDIEVSVIDGAGFEPYGQTTLDTLRDSYRNER